MAGMALPRPVAHSSGRVVPPQDDQAQSPLGSELHLEASFTWSHGSGHHSKTSVSQYLPLIQTQISRILEVCGHLIA